MEPNTYVVVAREHEGVVSLEEPTLEVLPWPSALLQAVGLWLLRLAYRLAAQGGAA